MSRGLKIDIVFGMVGLALLLTGLWGGSYAYRMVGSDHWALMPIFCTAGLLAVYGLIMFGPMVENVMYSMKRELQKREG